MLVPHPEEPFRLVVIEIESEVPGARAARRMSRTTPATTFLPRGAQDDEPHHARIAGEVAHDAVVSRRGATATPAARWGVLLLSP